MIWNCGYQFACFNLRWMPVCLNVIFGTGFSNGMSTKCPLSLGNQGDVSEVWNSKVSYLCGKILNRSRRLHAKTEVGFLRHESAEVGAQHPSRA